MVEGQTDNRGSSVKAKPTQMIDTVNNNNNNNNKSEAATPTPRSRKDDFTDTETLRLSQESIIKTNTEAASSVYLALTRSYNDQFNSLIQANRAELSTDIVWTSILTTKANQKRFKSLKSLAEKIPNHRDFVYLVIDWVQNLCANEVKQLINQVKDDEALAQLKQNNIIDIATNLLSSADHCHQQTTNTNGKAGPKVPYVIAVQFYTALRNYVESRTVESSDEQLMFSQFKSSDTFQKAFQCYYFLSKLNYLDRSFSDFPYIRQQLEWNDHMSSQMMVQMNEKLAQVVTVPILIDQDMLKDASFKELFKDSQLDSSKVNVLSVPIQSCDMANLFVEQTYSQNPESDKHLLQLEIAPDFLDDTNLRKYIKNESDTIYVRLAALSIAPQLFQVAKAKTEEDKGSLNLLEVLDSLASHKLCYSDCQLSGCSYDCETNAYDMTTQKWQIKVKSYESNNQGSDRRHAISCQSWNLSNEHDNSDFESYKVQTILRQKHAADNQTKTVLFEKEPENEQYLERALAKELTVQTLVPYLAFKPHAMKKELLPSFKSPHSELRCDEWIACSLACGQPLFQRPCDLFLEVNNDPYYFYKSFTQLQSKKRFEQFRDQIGPTFPICYSHGFVKATVKFLRNNEVARYTFNHHIIQSLTSNIKDFILFLSLAVRTKSAVIRFKRFSFLPKEKMLSQQCVAIKLAHNSSDRSAKRLSWHIQKQSLTADGAATYEMVHAESSGKYVQTLFRGAFSLEIFEPTIKSKDTQRLANETEHTLRANRVALAEERVAEKLTAAQYMTGNDEIFMSSYESQLDLLNKQAFCTTQNSLVEINEDGDTFNKNYQTQVTQMLDFLENFRGSNDDKAHEQAFSHGSNENAKNYLSYNLHDALKCQGQADIPLQLQEQRKKRGQFVLQIYRKDLISLSGKNKEDSKDNNAASSEANQKKPPKQSKGLDEHQKKITNIFQKDMPAIKIDPALRDETDNYILGLQGKDDNDLNRQNELNLQSDAEEDSNGDEEKKQDQGKKQDQEHKDQESAE